MQLSTLGPTGRRSHAALTAILATTATLALAACGGDESAPADDSSSAGASAPAGTPEWCGTQDVKLGIQDGGGLNAWSAASLAQVKLEADKCPNVSDPVVVNAGFDPQKATSGIQSMISQGVDALVIIPDAGVCAELPAMRQATQRGVKVATWGADGCGEPDRDYLSYSDWDPVAQGQLQTEWLAERMGGKGNLLFIGGPAGNLVDQGSVKGVLAALKKYPDIKLLGNVSEKSWPVTNWDPAQAQKVAASLLAKYDQVDGLFDGYGASVQGEIKAFRAANRKIPPIATVQLNSLSCEWAKHQGTERAFDLATISNRNWIGRLAARRAIAAAAGVDLQAKDIISLPLLEDSTDPSKKPTCHEGKGPDYDPSNDMSNEEFEALVRG